MIKKKIILFKIKNVQTLNVNIFLSGHYCLYVTFIENNFYFSYPYLYLDTF